MYRRPKSGRKQTVWHQTFCRRREPDRVSHQQDRPGAAVDGSLPGFGHLPGVCICIGLHLSVFTALNPNLHKIGCNSAVPPRKRAKFLSAFSALKLKLESSRLRADLENHLRVIVAICDGKSTEVKKGPLRSEDILEVVSLSFRVVGAISDVPVLHVMKPVVGIATLICDTAKCVQSNREAALALAARASTVTRSIVDRAAMDGAAVPDPEALNALKLALEDIQSYLTVLKNSRRRFFSWILANQVKDRFAKLDGGLDKAVALFSAAQALRTSGEVQANAHATAALVATVGRLDTTLTVIQADFGRLSIETPVHYKNNSFRSNFTLPKALLFFLEPQPKAGVRDFRQRWISAPLSHSH